MELPPNRTFIAGTVPLPTGGEPDVLAPPGDAQAEAGRSPIIVVGGGPSGMRVAQEVTRRGLPVILFNAERWRPYNRIKLTSFLAGEVQIGLVYQPNSFAPGARIVQYTGQTIVRIDRANKIVENQLGRCWQYSKLVLCLGSRPHIPPIPGRNLSGVYRFRNFDDVELLIARAMRARRAVVIGGGLLGLEAARGMLMRKVPTVVVEHENHLMARQLDEQAGAVLETQIGALGLDVRTRCSVKAIGGNGRVEQVVLSNGVTIACDTVIICTGIRPNIELARDTGVAIGRGIKVDDAMRTSDADVYAVGECAEHDGHVYGLVAPGLEQAAVAAAHLSGEPAVYAGSMPTTKLKVVGVDVFSMGDVEQLEQRADLGGRCWRNPADDTYRRLVTRRGRVVGALGVGPWPEINRIQQAVRDRAFVWPWQSWRVARTGRLYRERGPTPVSQWPGAATVCNCTGVTRGRLGDTIARGAGSIEALARETSASTVCGTCRPLLQELLGARVAQEPVFGARTIAAGSLLAAVIAFAAIALPSWPYSVSTETGLHLDRLWIDGAWKQVTGYTLLALSAAIAFLSVRKHIDLKWLGGYRAWRIVHTTLGAATLAILFLHTGFNLGANLNRWLITTFLAVAVIGGLTGIATAREHSVLAGGHRSFRNALTWLHILAVWPLPLLLFIHVVTVYAY
jgi:nitrite reductase (NADH) large subunit